MYSLATQTQPTWEFTGIDSMLPEPRLSPATRYYICRLLRQPINRESSELLNFRIELTEDNCSRLNEHLYKLYSSDIVELTTVIIKLDNLVYFHQSLDAQVVLYPEYVDQLIKIKQEIFRLLGFLKVLDS